MNYTMNLKRNQRGSLDWQEEKTSTYNTSQRKYRKNGSIQQSGSLSNSGIKK